MHVYVHLRVQNQLFAAQLMHVPTVFGFLDTAALVYRSPIFRHHGCRERHDDTGIESRGDGGGIRGQPSNATST